MNRFRQGQLIEKWVAHELEKQGYRILKENFYSSFGEIDIVCVHRGVLVFVEVKARSSKLFGEPYEAVSKSKLEKITRTGDYFRGKWKGKKLPEATRIDVASVLVDKDGEVTEFKLLNNVTR